MFTYMIHVKLYVLQDSAENFHKNFISHDVPNHGGPLSYQNSPVCNDMCAEDDQSNNGILISKPSSTIDSEGLSAVPRLSKHHLRLCLLQSKLSGDGNVGTKEAQKVKTVTFE